MRHTLQIFSVLCLSACLVLGLTSRVLAQARVRAKIGIQIHSSDGIRWAKATDRVKASDKFRIFIVPIEGAFIYGVHFNDKTVEPLVPEKLANKDTAIILPLDGGLYPFHSTDERESVTIIYSLNRLVHVWSHLLKSKNVPYPEWYAKWVDTEKQLIEQSKIEQREGSGESASEKQIRIGGTVRELPNQQSTAGDNIHYTLTLGQETSCVGPLTFHATNLPPGLSIDSSTGTITGTVSSEAAARHSYRVIIDVLTSQGKPCLQENTFTWHVQDRPFAKELQELRISSGKSLLVKRYEFTVKK